MRTAIVFIATSLCASLAQAAEDTWQNTCIARAKLALTLTSKLKADEKFEERQKNAASSSLKFIRYRAVLDLVPDEKRKSELFSRYEEFEFSNNAFEMNRYICKLLEAGGVDTPTKMECVRLISSQDEAILKKAFAGLRDAPAESIVKFKELKDVDYKRAFAEQMKLLEWAEAQLTKEFETEKFVDNGQHGYNHTGWILVHHIYDEIGMAQSIDVLYGVLLMSGKPADKVSTLTDLTFHFDLDELWNEPQLEVLNELKKQKGEFWTARGAQFWKVFSPWLAKNHSYFYYHPAEKKFRIDYAAREKGVSSKDYRSTHEWDKNEGPHKSDPAKVINDRDD